VVDVVERLASLGHQVTVHDPRADPAAAMHEYGIRTDPAALGRRYDLVVAAVAHQEYARMDASSVAALVNAGGLVADLKGMWRGLDLAGVRRWTL
jgi:UDP-N-acetyl-D-galactosamine dehydrogenase